MSCNCPCSSSTAFSRQNRTGSSGIGLGFREDGKSHGWKLERNHLLQFGRKRLWGQVTVASLEESRRGSYSPKPFKVLSGGIIAYLEEHDIVTFLDPPKELIPLDPASYNPAAYLWKKIGDVPQERRHRLLFLLKARHITRMWEVAGGRYQDAKLVNQSASSLLSMQNNLTSPEIWNCRTNKGPMPIAWIKDFKKFLFHAKDGKTYGRIDLGGAFLAGIAKSFIPLYFTVEHLKEVMPTEQPCDLAYEFGDGLLDLHDFPDDFPKPGCIASVEY